MRVTHGFRREERHLREVMQQIPFATHRAINDTLFEIRRREIETMTRVFDRPTKYVRDSVWVTKSPSKTQLTGKVEHSHVSARGGGFEGIPSGKILEAEVWGAQRRWKRSEHRWNKLGFLPTGWYAVPGPAADIDIYGNMTRRQILHILSYFQAWPAEGRFHGKARRVNTTTAGRRRLLIGSRARPSIQYFAVKVGEKNQLRPGIYQKIATSRNFVGPLPKSHLRPIIYFVNRMNYPERYPFYKVASDTAKAVYEERFTKRLFESMGTAR